MKAITTGSKKAKGKRLEKKVAQLIREKGLDSKARAMIGSGAFDNYKGDIYAPEVPLTFECKNQETVKIWEYWTQALAQQKVYKPACLIVSGNYRPILAILDIDTLLNLLKEIKDYENTQS